MVRLPLDSTGRLTLPSNACRGARVKGSTNDRSHGSLYEGEGLTGKARKELSCRQRRCCVMGEDDPIKTCVRPLIGAFAPGHHRCQRSTN
jgi:hypothetical protein